MSILMPLVVGDSQQNKLFLHKFKISIYYLPLVPVAPVPP